MPGGGDDLRPSEMVAGARRSGSNFRGATGQGAQRERAFEIQGVPPCRADAINQYVMCPLDSSVKIHAPLGLVFGQLHVSCAGFLCTFLCRALTCEAAERRAVYSALGTLSGDTCMCIYGRRFGFSTCSSPLMRLRSPGGSRAGVQGGDSAGGKRTGLPIKDRHQSVWHHIGRSLVPLTRGQSIDQPTRVGRLLQG